MTIFEQTDLMARGGSLALLALWSWLLLRDHRNILAARIAAMMNATIACYLLVTAGWGWRFSSVGLLLAIGAGTTPGLFWLFSKAWFNDEKRVGWVGVSLVLLSAANMLVMQLTFIQGGLVNQLTGVIFRLGMLAFACTGLWEAWRGRGGDLVEGRRRLRPRIVAAVGGYVIIIAFTEIAVFNAAAPHWIIHIVGSSIVFVNAVQDRYGLKKSNNSASLGVGAFGSVSLPFSSSNDSMVRVGSETIASEPFYDRFFELVRRYLVVEVAPPKLP